MIAEFFSQMIGGNSILQYTYFFSAIICSFLIGKIISWVCSTILLDLTKRTKTALDDFLAVALKWPLIVISVLLGIYFSFSFLTLGEDNLKILDQAFYVALTIYIAWFSTSVIKTLLQQIIKPLADKTDSKFDDHVAPMIVKVIKTVVWGIAALAIASRFGWDVTTLLAGLGIGGIAIAFAAQKTIADVFGGLSILFSRPFVIGQRIEITTLNLIGDVTEIGLRNTRIKDLDGRINTIPNSDLSAVVIKNVTSEPQRRVITDLGLVYDTSSEKLKQAKEIVRNIINSNDRCIKDPVISFSNFNDSSLNIKVIYWIIDKQGEKWRIIQDEVNMAIKEEFEKNSIEFAFPTQTVILKK